jgi:hypothetical protein
LLHLFFRRDPYRERVYLTREAYLAIAVVALLGLALFLAGAAQFREALGLAALRSPATPIQSSSSSAASQAITTTTQATAIVSPSSNPSGGTKATAIPSPVLVCRRCPITWHVQEVAKAGGGRMGLADDNSVGVQVRQNFREAMAWANAPSGPWNLAEVDQYYTAGMAQQVRTGLQLSLNRQEYVQVEMTDLGTLSLSFTPDGGGVTFMSVQYEPITQTIRDTATGTVKRTVVLDDVPYRQVGIAMLYDTQACRRLIGSVPERVWLRRRGVHKRSLEYSRWCWCRVWRC